MRSLRARLILGFSLVAVVPLGLTILLLGQRVQRTISNELNVRLAAAMRVVRVQLETDGERLRSRLRLIAGDPQLRRMVLVDSGSNLELRQYLEEQRFLLRLDYLAVLDSTSHVQADAATAPASRPVRTAIAVDSLPPAYAGSAPVVPVAATGGLAFDGSAPITYQDVRVGRLRGGQGLDSLYAAGLKQTTGFDVVLRTPSGRVLASTLPPAGAPGPAPRPQMLLLPATRGDGTVRVTIAGHAYLLRDEPLGELLASNVRLSALAPTTEVDNALAVLWTTALLLGLVGLVLAVMLAGLWSHQVSRPVELLAEFSERISRGEWDEPLDLQSVRELQTLVDALERMRGELRAYRDRLVAGERQAAYGRMARQVAHEIKNPLTPIAVSVAGLQRAYDQRRAEFPVVLAEAVRTVGEEVQRLKTLLQGFSDLGRFPSPRPVRFNLVELLGDLRALYAHEVDAGRLALEWPPGPLVLVADRDQLRQAILNLVQNGLDAIGPDGHVRVTAAAVGGHVRLEVRDDGPGLDAEQRAQLFVPGFTTKAQGSGLGLTIVERIVSDHHGNVDVESAPGRGTAIVVRLPQEPGS